MRSSILLSILIPFALGAISSRGDALPPEWAALVQTLRTAASVNPASLQTQGPYQCLGHYDQSTPAYGASPEEAQEKVKILCLRKVCGMTPARPYGFCLHDPNHITVADVNPLSFAMAMEYACAIANCGAAGANLALKAMQGGPNHDKAPTPGAADTLLNGMNQSAIKLVPAH